MKLARNISAIKFPFALPCDKSSKLFETLLNVEFQHRNYSNITQRGIVRIIIAKLNLFHGKNFVVTFTKQFHSPPATPVRRFALLFSRRIGTKADVKLGKLNETPRSDVRRHCFKEIYYLSFTRAVYSSANIPQRWSRVERTAQDETEYVNINVESFFSRIYGGCSFRILRVRRARTRARSRRDTFLTVSERPPKASYARRKQIETGHL